MHALARTRTAGERSPGGRDAVPATENATPATRQDDATPATRQDDATPATEQDERSERVGDVVLGDVVVGVDGSPDSDAALAWALATAARRGRPVTALIGWTADGHPRHVFRSATTADHAGLTRAAADTLNRALARVPMPDPPVDVVRLVVDRDPAEALLAQEDHAAMIVVGGHSHGPLRRLLVGAVAQRLLHHATVPVVLVRDGRDGMDQVTGSHGGADGDAGRPAMDDRPVVVGVDGSPPSLAALRWAATEASLRQVQLRVIHAYRLGGSPYSTPLDNIYPRLRAEAEHLLERAVAEQLTDLPGLDVIGSAVLDTPARCLLEAAHDAQLLVVGSRGHGGFAGLTLGSVSHQCVTHATGVVAVIRPVTRI